MKKSILLITIICSVYLATAQWNTQSPYPTSNTLWDVCFVNENIGWITGEKGTIIKTNDSGITWTNQESGSIQTIRCMSFLDLNNAWIVGDSGTILNTNDGGENWMDQSISDTIDWYGVEFKDQNNGWVVGQSSGDGIIIHTSDAGNNWEFQLFEPDNGFNDLCFTSLTSGWVSGSDGIMHTSDGGNTWQIQFSDPLANLNSIFFLDSLYGWSVGSGVYSLILHTIDGGTSWESDSVSFMEYGGLNDVLFTDSSNGYIIGEGHNQGNHYSRFLRTIDGGNTWFDQSAPNGAQPKGICFINEIEGWIVGAYGNITFTENSGDDWIRKSLQTNDLMITDIFFFDDQNGLAIGNSNYTFNVSYFLKTTNGGHDWLIKSTFWSYTGKLIVIDENNFWVIGNMVVYYTNDGGINWGNAGPLCYIGTNDIFFTDIQNGWATSWNWSDDLGSIYHTSDEGENWDIPYTGEEEYFRSIYFIDQNTGWVAGRSGDSGIIINTMDGGLTWTNQLYENNQFFIKTHFFDSYNGIVIDYHGSVFHTSDGGDSWTQVNTGFDIDISNVFVVDPDHMWIVGSINQYPQPVIEGLIYHSGDGGQTWTEQESGTFRELNGIWFNNTNEGWIVGDYGTILHTDNGGINEIPQVEVPKSNFYLRNFPNPFNSRTTIEFTIPGKGLVKLSTIDYTGKEIQTLISEQISAGTHQFDWNAVGLPSGIYFLRLEVNGISETRKLILLN